MKVQAGPVEALLTYVRGLERQVAELKAALADAETPKVNNDLAELLREALSGKPGWSERARLAIGDYKMIPCEFCGTPFPSGGKRKKYCGKCSGGRP
jgi:hypothetical protein